MKRSILGLSSNIHGSPTKTVLTLIAAMFMFGGIHTDARAQCACQGGSAATFPAPGMTFSAGAIPQGSVPPASPMSFGAQGMQLEGNGIPAGQILDSDAIYLTVNVPKEAVVEINGDPTISEGATRHFVVRNLEPDRQYKFVIVAETANPAGVAMEQTETVTLTPGSAEAISLKPFKRKKPDPSSLPQAEAETGGDE